jgi:hypothetical protein
MDAICTWGEGPDVMINLNGTILVLYEEPNMKGFKYGTIKQGSIDLRLDEAKEFRNILDKAIKEVERMQRELEEYVKNDINCNDCDKDNRVCNDDSICHKTGEEMPFNVEAYASEEDKEKGIMRVSIRGKDNDLICEYCKKSKERKDMNGITFAGKAAVIGPDIGPEDKVICNECRDEITLGKHKNISIGFGKKGRDNAGKR